MFDDDVDHGSLTGNVGFGPEPDRHVLPDGLEKIPPGPFLGAMLETVDPARLNGHDAVRYVNATSTLTLVPTSPGTS